MLDWLFEHDFVSLGQVYQWRSDIVWLHVASNLLIAGTCFAIPLGMSYMFRKRASKSLRRVGRLFAAYWLLVGTTYVLSAVAVWIPIYVFNDAVKAVLALVAIFAVPMMLRLISLSLTLRSPAELAHANEQLLAEAEMRRATEQELRLAHETAVQASRAKSGFLANMSHEIRTPMNAVMGMTAALLKTPLTPEQQEFAETIRISSESLLALINDILDLSKIEAGADSVEAAELQLDEVLERAIVPVAERAHAKGLELITVVETSVPATLRGDARHLHQVLVNLASNAVKFTPRGEIELRAALESQTDDRAVVRFTVRDTGIGILREARDRLFQPFMQADSSTTRKYGGTGLGLAISKSLVEAMGGTIDVESHTGRGSTFRFSVPLEKIPSTAPEAVADASLRGTSVLLVEDNDTNRGVLTEQMTEWGMRVNAVRDGAAALEQLAGMALGHEPAYEFAVIDRGLPGMGGLELAGRLRRMPALAGMHIVNLHHLTSRDATAALHDAGVEASLTKPLRHSLLRSTLAALLGRGKLSVPTAAAAAHRPALNEPETPLAGRWQILVSEDNTLNQQVLRLQLKELGQHADFTSDGLEALQALQLKPYDVVLMDCQMPGLDGYDATAEIRRRERGSRHTWIIATTAHAMVGDRDRCLAAGMDDYIAKPMSTRTLREALERFAQRAPAFVPARGAPAATAAAVVPGAADTAAAIGIETVGFARLRDVAHDDAGLVRQLAELYVTQTAEQLGILHTELAARSSNEIRRIAHRCIGSSATAGMTQIADLFRKLEQAGAKGQLEQARQLVADIDSAFVQVRGLVKNLPSAPTSAGGHS